MGRQVGGRNREFWLLVFGLSIAALAVSFLVLSSPPKDDGGTALPALDVENDNLSDKDVSHPADKYVDLREEMVRKDIEPRGVSDSLVLSAMRKVLRHEFVPEDQRRDAYRDTPLPIGYGQTISQPYIVAVMTEALGLKKNVSRALEIGTGSGYQAAVLAEICAEVFSIEIVSELAARSTTTLSRLGYNNVRVENTDGYFGWEEHAPYDAIIITCAASHISQHLVEQLAEGGRLVVPLGSPYSWQTLTIMEKKGDDTTLRYMFPVVFVPMTGEIEDR